MIFAPSHVRPTNLRISGYAHLTVVVSIISSSIAVYFRRMLNRLDQNLLQFITFRLEFEDAQTLSQCTGQLLTRNSSPSQPKCQVENFRYHLQGIFDQHFVCTYFVSTLEKDEPNSNFLSDYLNFSILV